MGSGDCGEKPTPYAENRGSPSSKPCRTWHHQDLVVNKQIRCQRVLSSGDCAEKSTPPMLENTIHQIRPSSRITTRPYPHLTTRFDALPNPTTIAMDDPFIRPFVSHHHPREATDSILIDGFRRSKERARVYTRGIWDMNKLPPGSAGAMCSSPQRCRPPLLDTDKELYRIRPRLMRLDATIFLAIRYRPVSIFSLLANLQHFSTFRF